MARPKKRKINKSEFVRKMGSMKASDVVARAKKKGIILSERYVYVIRSSDKAKARRKAERGGARVLTSIRGRPRKTASVENELKALVVEHGLRRVREAVAEIEALFA